ncbi:hypothetical protein VTN00DRAFT_6487 [Thermoascus crustaceus]|uniref:uncharacterized protein n=1 Tax=Thermoascus crustaceus TaxID=5088 RepID=UPI003742DED7
MKHGLQDPEHRPRGYPREDGCSWDLQARTVRKSNVLQRYESEEEEASEADAGSQDRAFSPIDCDSSDTGAFDSESSADEITHEEERENRSSRNLLFPYLPAGGRTTRSRPVSIDTVKRRSDVTFVPDSFSRDDDDDDDEITSPSTPISNSPPPSSRLLHPTVFVPPEASESEVLSYHQSYYHDPVLSDDEPDIESPLLVATPILYRIPTSRPSLISISPPSEQSTADDQEQTSSHSRSSSNSSSWSNNSAQSSGQPGSRKGHSKQNSSLSSVPSTYSGEFLRAPTYPPSVGTPLCPDGDSYVDKKADSQSPSDEQPKPSYQRERTGSTASSHSILSSAESVTTDGETEQTETGATITCLSEIPAIPFTTSPKAMSMSFSRPIISISDRESMYSASQKQRRPASAIAERRQSSTRRSVSSSVTSTSSNSRTDPLFLNPNPDEDDHHLFIKSMPHCQYMFDSQSLQSLRNARRSSMSPRPHSRRPLASSPTPYANTTSSSSIPSPHSHTGGHRPGSAHSERLSPNKTYPFLTHSSSRRESAINSIRSSSTTDLSLSYGSGSAHAVSPIEDIIPELNGSDDTDVVLPEQHGKDNNKNLKRASRVAAMGKGFMGLKLGRRLKRAATPEDAK